jgi:chorismate mutase
MSSIVKTFSDGTVIEFDAGSFDTWCVYVKNPNGKRHAPKDINYFQSIIFFSNKYSVESIYDDFVQIYVQTKNKVETEVLNLIIRLSNKYGEDSVEIEKIYTIIYSAMIAEQNKKFSILGKRIKRLAIYQILFDKIGLIEAVNYSRGKPWRELDNECQMRGF